MKKTIFQILFILVMSSSLFAQYIQADFEENGLGANWAWVVGENGDNPPLEFITNPDMSGMNTSETVAQFTARQNGQPWALCFSDDIDEFEFDATNSTIKIMVHKPVISNVALKFEGSGPDIELQQSNTVINQWEELTFDFSSMIGNAYNRLIIIPDFQEREQDNVLYLDNIQLPEMNVDPTPEPTEPAPGPTELPENVISLFSDSYDDVTVDTWSADWDQADVADVFIEGNITKLYTNFTYAGIEFTSQTIDATAMTTFHMDIWTADDTAAPAVFKVKLVDFGPDGVWGADDTEHEITFDENTMDSEVWVSLDIPLSNFTGLASTAHLAQLIISGDPNTIFVDNVYFYNESSSSANDDVSPANVFYSLENNYPNPFNPSTTISYSLTKTGFVSLDVYNIKGQLVENLVQENKLPNTYQLTWNAEGISSGIYFYRLKIDNQIVDTKRMILMK